MFNPATIITYFQQESRRQPPPERPRDPIRLAGTTTLFGKSLLNLSSDRKITSEPRTSYKKRKNVSRMPPRSSDPLELDLRLSPVTGTPRRIVAAEVRDKEVYYKL